MRAKPKAPLQPTHPPDLGLDVRPVGSTGAGQLATAGQPEGEKGGPKGPEPTRFGDWEKGGRCFDF